MASAILSRSSSMTILYLSLEIQSLCIYVLASIYGLSEKAAGAALTYFLVGSIASSLVLLGITEEFSATGSLLQKQFSPGETR